jgi:hypothetical protein
MLKAKLVVKQGQKVMGLSGRKIARPHKREIHLFFNHTRKEYAARFNASPIYNLISKKEVV